MGTGCLRAQPARGPASRHSLTKWPVSLSTASTRGAPGQLRHVTWAGSPPRPASASTRPAVPTTLAAHARPWCTLILKADKGAIIMVAQICFEVRGSLAWVDLTTGGRRADGSSKFRCARAQRPHEQSKPDIVYMSESGRTGRVANGVANAMDERDARCTARSARRPPTAFLHGTARDGRARCWLPSSSESAPTG